MFNTYLPNLMIYQQEFIKSIIQTLQLVSVSAVFSLSIGLVCGVLLVVCRKGGILEQPFLFRFLDVITNLIRSIPFVILIPVLMPFTRLIIGTSVGTKGAYVPLVVGCVPFFMRQVDLALSDVNPGLIEAAQSMGLSPFEIITRVYIKESVPLLIRAVTITLVSLIGLSAMAGAIGGGGLGDFVIRYGHNRFMHDITYVSVILILIMVTLIELIGHYFIKKTTH